MADKLRFGDMRIRVTVELLGPDYQPIGEEPLDVVVSRIGSHDARMRTMLVAGGLFDKLKGAHTNEGDTTPDNSQAFRC